MWVELKRTWMNYPKGQRLNLVENIAITLMKRKTAIALNVDETGEPVEKKKVFAAKRGRPKQVDNAPNKMVTSAANK